jgi:hypothetical protein
LRMDIFFHALKHSKLKHKNQQVATYFNFCYTEKYAENSRRR